MNSLPAPELSVIVPAFNEASEIESNIRSIQKAVESLKVTYEIIIVDDGSRDQTLAIAQALCGPTIRTVSYSQNRGKGHAIRYGMQEAKGDFRLFMDVDLSTSLEAIGPFLKCLQRQECDMAIGDRKSNPAAIKIRQPFYRRFLGNGFIALSQWTVGKKVSDFTCGFKMFNRKAAEILFNRQRIDNWAFDTELIYIAQLHQLSIKEIPVQWHHNHSSNVRPLRDVFTSLEGLIRMKYYALRGYYR